MKYEDLGTVTVKHESGMAETDKGYRFPASSGVGKGDQLIEQEGHKIFVDGAEYKKMLEVQKGVTKVRYQTGVTAALREQAKKLGVDFDTTTTKETLLVDIETARSVLDEDDEDV